MTSIAATTNSQQPDYDVLIIGAGVCGIYMLHRMLGEGVNVTVLEVSDGPGGTWYHNRYPGARFDSESYTYGYSFSKEILEEWSWSEHFAGQPETLEYLNFVVDKLKLSSHIQFGCKVKAATFVDGGNYWKIETEDGRTLTTRYLLTAIGLLSAPTMPKIDGVDSFGGESFHTYYAPHEPVGYEGKKVAVIGTGATGVQIISEIADKVSDLTVFQRRPNWCAPLQNRPINEDEQKKIKSSYDDIFGRCGETPGGFIHGPDPRPYSEVSGKERLEFWEELYKSPGFGVWLGNFVDVLVNESANAEYSSFIADKIRQRVNDPATAEKLIPKDHGFGTRRVPLETRYYEAYNRDNVHLVDLNETPIERITKNGIKTSDGELEFDVIIYATGFDAITGAFDRIDITGQGGKKLRDKWRDGPITYLGVQVAGFPNMITLAGPQSGTVSTNFPRGIEAVVDWTTGFLEFMRTEGYQRFEATDEAEQEWTEHVKSMYDGSMISGTKSWFTGYNSNVEGHDKLRYMVYFGGSPRYREFLTELAGNKYDALKLS
jgi:cation diffusion facilitator CzcD-associated flavoprotein CzcO